MPPADPRTIVTGSIATDHLMHFPGRFADQFIAGKLATVSLSFLVDDLTVRHGGVAANIAYGMAQLGASPVLVGSAGADFDDGYRARLERCGVDTRHVRISTTAHTARFVCTTDDDQCQIASFYPGAMSEAAQIDLDAVGAAAGPPALVLLGPDHPEAMTRHARTCRRRGWPFAADPSQQLARMDAAQVVDFITGAAFLFTNAYEHDLLLARTGMTGDELSARVGVTVTTLGADGVRISEPGGVTVVAARPVPEPADPTGAGDAFRAGFLAGLGNGLALADAAALGCRLAELCLRSHGTQEYRVGDDLRAALRPTPQPAGW